MRLNVFAAVTILIMASCSLIDGNHLQEITIETNKSLGNLAKFKYCGTTVTYENGVHLPVS